MKSNVRLLELVWNQLLVDKKQLSALMLKAAKDASMAEVSTATAEAPALVEQALAEHKETKQKWVSYSKSEVGQLASTQGVHAEVLKKAKQANGRSFKVVVAAKKVAVAVNKALVDLEHSAVVKEAVLAIANEAARAVTAAAAAKEATAAAAHEIDMLIAASLDTATPDTREVLKDSPAHNPATPECHNSQTPTRPARPEGTGSDSGCCQVS